MSTTFADLVARAKASTTGLSPVQAQKHIADTGVILLDLRERETFVEGHIPGAKNLSRSFLELQIESISNKRDASILLYGEDYQGPIGAEALQNMGYTQVAYIDGGYNAWVKAGLPTQKNRALNKAEVQRYSRHLLVPEVGEEGQAKLLQARVLLLGAGGLGSPTAYYLAAAGVGTLGIVDADVVDVTNLQRQILHGTSDVGRPKAISAYEKLKDLNPGITIVPHVEYLTSDNVFDVIDQYDIVVNGCDNFPTRYLINDACVFRGKPIVDGSIFRFEGQVTIYACDGEGPCYRCLYPEPPPPDLAPSCNEAGVLGVLPGTVGLIQATEVVKLILGIGEPLIGRLLMFDALAMSFKTFKVRRDKNCPVCGDTPTITELIDYVQFCAGVHLPAEVAAD